MRQIGSPSQNGDWLRAATCGHKERVNREVPVPVLDGLSLEKEAVME